MTLQGNMYQGWTGQFNITGVTSLIPSTSSGYSNTVFTAGLTLCGIYTPAALTGSSFTFYAAPSLGTNPGNDPGTFVQIYTSIGQTYGAYTVTATESAYIALNEDVFKGVAYLQVKSSSSESAQRTLILSLKGLT